jgi:hypothetical protein
MRCILLLCLLGLVAARANKAAPSCRHDSNPFTTVTPVWYGRPLDPRGKLRDWAYDGITPRFTQAIRAHGNDMSVPIHGRGSENPLRMVS